MTKIQITNSNDFNKRLDCFLADYFKDYFKDSETENLKITRAKIPNLIDFFLVNNKPSKVSYKLKENDIIEFDKTKLIDFLSVKPLEPYNYKLDIIFEDDELLVINKPKNMLTHPTKYDDSKTLVNALLNYCPDNLSDIGGVNRRGIVHRLDKNTAGLILIAKTNEAHKNLAEQIKYKKAKRKYLAIALGIFEKQSGLIDKPLVHYLESNVKMTVADEGLEARTLYKVIEQYKGAALVELELQTGRTHQIRAHLASINHPVFNDTLYNAKKYTRKEFFNLKTDEQVLQSYFLNFTHPKSGELMEFQLKEEDFSKDFIKVLHFLRSNYAV